MTPSSTQARKRGRPSKGDRVGTHVSLPAEFRAEIEALAARDGLPMGSIITRLVANALGKPEPYYCQPTTTAQGELPLAEAS